MKQRKVYVFGNPDVSSDNRVFEVVSEMEKKMGDINFVRIGLNKDLPFENEDNSLLIDTIQGIDKVEIFDLEDINKYLLSSRTSVHDFDLGFQLKYLKKIGKLGKIRIIGIPQKGQIDYSLIQSILRKFVAQDIHGS